MMISVFAFAGVAHSSAANAPTSHVLRFMAWRSFPIHTYASAPLLASRNLPPSRTFPLRPGGHPSYLDIFPLPSPVPLDPNNADPAFRGKTGSSPASEGGTPNQ